VVYGQATVDKTMAGVGQRRRNRRREQRSR